MQLRRFSCFLCSKRWKLSRWISRKRGHWADGQQVKPAAAVWGHECRSWKAKFSCVLLWSQSWDMETSQPTHLTWWAQGSSRAMEDTYRGRWMRHSVLTPGLHTHTCALAHITHTKDAKEILFADKNWNLVLNISFSGTNNYIQQNMCLIKMQSFEMPLIINVNSKAKYATLYLAVAKI